MNLVLRFVLSALKVKIMPSKEGPLAYRATPARILARVKLTVMSALRGIFRVLQVALNAVNVWLDRSV